MPKRLHERDIQNEMQRHNLCRITAIRRLQARNMLLASRTRDGAPLHYVPFAERHS